MRRPHKLYALIAGKLFGEQVQIGDEVEVPEGASDEALQMMLNTGVVTRGAKTAERAAGEANEAQQLIESDPK